MRKIMIIYILVILSSCSMWNNSWNNLPDTNIANNNEIIINDATVKLTETNNVSLEEELLYLKEYEEDRLLRDEQEKKIDTQNKEKITTSNIVSNLDIEDLLENELFEKLNKEESIIIDKANNDYKKNIDENIELIKQYYDYLNYNDYY